jgi:hypothetical protein
VQVRVLPATSDKKVGRIPVTGYAANLFLDLHVFGLFGARVSLAIAAD